MSCKKHPTDQSSTVGVCALCLSERLFELMAEQAQARQAQLEQLAHSRAYAAESQKKPDTAPPPLLFPCSISSYVTRRKSDHTTTRQVGLTYNTVNGVTPSITTSRSSSKFGRFSVLFRRFRSRAENYEGETNRNSDTRDSCDASSSLPSPFANIFSARQKKKSRFAMDDASCTECRRPRRNADRRMSPVGGLETDCEYSDRGPSGNGNAEESSQVRKKPVGGPSAARRGKPGHGWNLSTGLLSCLSR